MPPASFEDSGAEDVPVLHLSFVADASHSIQLQSLAVHVSGSGNDLLEIAAVHLWLDPEGDGDLGGDDTRVNVLPLHFPADDGLVLFDLSAQDPVPEGGAVHYLVTADFTGAGAGSDFTFRCTPDADVQAVLEGTATAVTPPSADPEVVGGAKTIHTEGAASLMVTRGVNDPPAGAWFAPVADLSLLQIRTRAGSVEGVRISGARFALFGTGGFPAARLDFVLDKDGDGLVSEFDDLLGSETVQAGAEFVRFPSLGLDLPKGDGAVLLLVGTFSAVSGEISAALTAGSDVEAAGLESSLGIEASGAPVFGTTRTLISIDGSGGGESGGCSPAGAGPGNVSGFLALLTVSIVLASLLRKRARASAGSGTPGPRFR
jgi:hypothetical protein